MLSVKSARNVPPILSMRTPHPMLFRSLRSAILSVFSITRPVQRSSWPLNRTTWLIAAHRDEYLRIAHGICLAPSRLFRSSALWWHVITHSPVILYRRDLIIEMRALTFDTFHSRRAYSALARRARYLPLCNSLLLSHGKAPGALITVAVSVPTLDVLSIERNYVGNIRLRGDLCFFFIAPWKEISHAMNDAEHAAQRAIDDDDCSTISSGERTSWDLILEIFSRFPASSRRRRLPFPIRV